MAEALVSAFIGVWLMATTTIDAFEFETAADEARFADLVAEFRCPKCLNTNLAGSNAPIAQDLRRTVYRLMLEEKNDAEIRAFLQERYGDFVLYDPPLKPGTWVLWFLPIALIILGLVVLRRVGVRRTPVTLTAEERRVLDAIDHE